MRRVTINLQHKDKTALRYIQDVLNSSDGEPQIVALSPHNAQAVNRDIEDFKNHNGFNISMPAYFFNQLNLVEDGRLDDQTLILGYEVDYIYDEFYYMDHNNFMADLNEAIHGIDAYNNKVESVVLSHSAWHKFIVNPDIRRMAERSTASESTIFGVRHRRADNMRENMVKVIYSTPHNPRKTITEIYQ